MKKSKRVKKSNTWKIKQHRDQFFKKSKTLGYRSRAAFKLIELNDKFKFIRKNTNLLDLGSCPGGWSQVASKIITEGKVLSIDIKQMRPIYNVKFLHCNFFESSTKDKIKNYIKGKLDVIVSDMAADTTGNKDLDCIRTNGLTLDVLSFGKKYLKPGGHLVAKLFMGTDFDLVQQNAKKNFKKIHFFNPEASKKESKETYIVCLK